MSDYKKILQQEIEDLKQQVQQADLPDEMLLKVNKEILSLERSVELGSYDEKYEKVSKYISWVLKVPWKKESKDSLDIGKAKAIFDEHHFGLEEVKNRFLEYIAVLNLRGQDASSDFSAPVLLLVGLVGTGKTTFAYSLAEALGREIVRVPFGGMASAKELRGSSRLIL